MPVDLSRVQALVLTLYRCPAARHLLFRFDSQAGARGFLAGLRPLVTMADADLSTAPDPLLNVGLTFGGFCAAGASADVAAALDSEYRRGPNAPALGDVEGTRSDPASWWEGRFRTEELHCVVHLHVRETDALDGAHERVRALARQSGVSELVPRADGTPLDTRSLGGGRLHFGYTDGISHPELVWDDTPDSPTQTSFRHFLLGYSKPGYESAPAAGAAADLVRDSAYGVFRWLYQDVAGFNAFLAREAGAQFPALPAADAQELLAAKLLGRWRDGTPLVLSADAPHADLARSDDFSYAQDADGRACPFSAHIRVVNPRDQPLDPVVVDGVPRVLRRGMPYGPGLDGTEDDGRDRGLVGIFLCADIRRQVYTLTSWISRNDFSPVYAPDRRRRQDALVANRAVPSTDRGFRVPGAKGVAHLPDFVHTKGTALLLYPSGPALAALAGG